jgi:hypothetical protein
MIFPAKLILNSLPGVDPVIFLAMVCLGLGACFIVLLMELEETRVRWRENAMKRRSLAPQPRAIPYRQPRDRRKQGIDS